MPFAQLDGLCALVTVTPREICFTYPVNQRVCYELPQLANADGSELLMGFFNKVNDKLGDLAPLFDVLDILLAVFECIKAIPDAITKLDPTGLIECIPGLAEAVQKLLKYLPQYSIPVMIVEIIDAMILYLQAQRNQMFMAAQRQIAIIDAATRAAEPGNFQFALVMDCISNNYRADIVNMNEQLQGLNRLMGIVNAIMELIGLDPLPSVGEIADPNAGLQQLDDLIELLRGLRSTIPVPVDP